MDLLVDKAILLLPDQVLSAPGLADSVAHLPSVSCAMTLFSAFSLCAPRKPRRATAGFIAEPCAVAAVLNQSPFFACGFRPFGRMAHSQRLQRDRQILQTFL